MVVAWFRVVDSDGSGGNGAIFAGSRLICRQTGVVCCADIIVMLWMRWCCATAGGGAAKQAGGGCRGEGAAPALDISANKIVVVIGATAAS